MSRNHAHNIAYRLHTVLILSLASALFVMLNLIGVQVDRSYTVANDIQPLSQRAKDILADVTGDVKCTVILPNRDDISQSLHTLINNMADSAVNAHIVIDFIDPYVDIPRAADAVRKYGDSGWVVAFESAGRHVTVQYDNLVEWASDAGIGTKASHQVVAKFSGEQACVTALARLLHPSSAKIYVLTGHGECDFNSYNPLSGYSDIAREIRREGYTLAPLTMQAEEVPSDCDLLFIAGPRRSPSAADSAAICTYLQQGGRMLLLIDRSDVVPNGWEHVMRRIGLKFANLTAINANTLGGYNLLVDRFSSHTIAKNLEHNAIFFVNPQVIFADDSVPNSTQIKIDVVAAAPGDSWGETTPDVLPRNYNDGIDVKDCQLPLAVAVEIAGSSDIALKPMRAFVIGDSNFGANSLIEGGRTTNRDFLLNAVNWLTDAGLSSNPSIPAESNPLRLSFSRRRQLRFWSHSVLLWPLTTGLCGLIMAWLRKLTT